MIFIYYLFIFILFYFSHILFNYVIYFNITRSDYTVLRRDIKLFRC